MNDPIQRADLSIIGLVGLPADRYGIRTVVHELALRDGSVHRLRLVLDVGLPATYLRALQLEDRSWLVFDLRRICRQIGPDLCQCATRDVPGVVMYSLRAVVPDRAAFAAAVRAAAVAIGPLLKMDAPSPLSTTTQEVTHV